MKKKPQKIMVEKVEYKCINCNYATRNKKDYKRHLQTKKHLRLGEWIKKTPIVEFKCLYCKKNTKLRAD